MHSTYYELKESIVLYMKNILFNIHLNL